MKIRSLPVVALIAIILILLALFLRGHFLVRPEKIKVRVVGWREDFGSVSPEGRPVIPRGWEKRGKPGTPPAIFSVVRDDKDGLSFLRVEADKASASLICKVKGVDLEKMPVLRWRWRAVTLPEGADGRERKKDDQAIGIYVGTGKGLGKKSISYRWDTETPKGTEGNCAYGGGTIKVKWFTLRDREDAVKKEWFVDERDFMKDFENAWGFRPGKVYMSVSCNSQYTGTDAAADLDWIEFVSVSDNAENIQEKVGK
ncbi:MAG: DUF3047 domain-containing protein [Candidatus Omnitrophota bacterium]|nr:DUF3047 domain-containing protein [Candidatus Omnitrophota bacterium]